MSKRCRGMRTAARWALAVLVVTAHLLGAPAAHAAPTRLDMSASVVGGQIQVVGTLTSEGAPVNKGDLTVALDGYLMATTRSHGNGAFAVAFDIPPEVPAGAHTVTVSFAGRRPADPATASHTVTIGAPPNNNEPNSDPARPPDRQATITPSSAPPPPPVLKRAQLEAEGPGQALNGEVVTILGTLRHPNGQALEGVGVSISDESGDVSDSYTVTGPGGRFSTYYLVPEDHPAGKATLTISVDATSSYKAASTSVSITVLYTEVRTPDPASPTPSPSASASRSAAPKASGSAAPSPQATASPPTERKVGPSEHTLQTFLFLLVLIGALAAAVALALVFRGRLFPPRSPAGNTAVDEFLDDEDDDPDAPSAPHPKPATPRRGVV